MGDSGVGSDLDPQPLLSHCQPEAIWALCPPAPPPRDKGQWAGILCSVQLWGETDEMWLDMLCEKT